MSLLVPDRTPNRLQIALGRRDGEGPGGDAARLLGLVADLDGHDRRSRGHSGRVRGYTDLVAQELRLGKRDRELLRWAALLHDVGKLKVPSPTLERSGRLTDADWRAVRQHPVEGARLIAPLRTWLGPWASTVVQHHERWDGTGYPGGLAGMQISLGARIVAVADAFETMTTSRDSRPSTAAAAREELARCAGRQFDPVVVRAFLQVSMRRLRWVMGPLTWAAEQPFLGGVQQAATRVGTVGARIGAGAATAGVVAGTVVVGGVATPAAHPGQVATSEQTQRPTDERGVIDVFLHRHVPDGTAPAADPGDR
jgi:putative nucleotidyltransferase with HDIG domain